MSKTEKTPNSRGAHWAPATLDAERVSFIGNGWDIDTLRATNDRPYGDDTIRLYGVSRLRERPLRGREGR